MAAARSLPVSVALSLAGAFSFCCLMSVVQNGPKPHWGMPCLALQGGAELLTPPPLPHRALVGIL